MYTSFYDLKINSIDGKALDLSQFKDHVILLVNTASKCGFTNQYKDLESLYNKYKNKKFVIIGFPANNFMRQEPGTNKEIKQFCEKNYGVSFPITEKISVRGKDIHPIFQFLTLKTHNPEFSGKVTWNFNKFLMSKNGRIIDRFSSSTNPLSKKIQNRIEKAL